MPYCLYLRKSRADRDFESAGIEETLARHEKALLELSKKKRLSVTAIYKEVVSGESIADRPQMKLLLSEVEKGLWEGVLVMEVERLARGNTKDQGIVAEAFQLSNTKIITPTKTYDPNNEFDEEYFEFGLFMSRREYKAINRRIQRGRVASAREGKFLGSQPPFGYDKIKLTGEKGYTLQPNQNADTVRLIFDLYVNGKKLSDNSIKPMGLALIAKELDLLNIKPLISEVWRPSSIKTIITNPVYIGKIRWSWDKELKIVENGTIKKTRKHNDECIFVDGLHPAIIDNETFNKAQEILSSKKIYPIVSNKILKNPLAGIVFCGKCGALMTRQITSCHSGKPKKYALRCPNPYCNNISAEIQYIEKAIINSTKNWLNQYSLQWKEKQTKETSPVALSAKKTLHKQQTEELETLKKQINNTYDLLEQGVYDINKFKERNTFLSEKKEKLENSISALTAEITDTEKDKGLTEGYLPTMRKFTELYYSLDYSGDKNSLLHNVFEKIEYTKTEKGKKNHAESANFTLKLFPKLPQ